MIRRVKIFFALLSLLIFVGGIVIATMIAYKETPTEFIGMIVFMLWLVSGLVATFLLSDL
jgi:hypothetical protein